LAYFQHSVTSFCRHFSLSYHSILANVTSNICQIKQQNKQVCSVANS
jgi:hypothetical protein